MRMGDTSNTHFWHARKFRDSTTVMRGGLCEDNRSGYFAGAFMGRKFKNPATREFERSLEYLLDDLTATSNEALPTATPSSNGSCMSLDTLVDHDSFDENGTIKNGFLINVAITDKHQARHRPRSDIFDFIHGGTSPYYPTRATSPIKKSKSLCDVSIGTKPKLSSTREAKLYQEEFEKVLDDLHSTIDDLESLSRETLNESEAGSTIGSLSSLTPSVSELSCTSELYVKTPTPVGQHQSTRHLGQMTNGTMAVLPVENGHFNNNSAYHCPKQIITKVTPLRSSKDYSYDTAESTAVDCTAKHYSHNKNSCLLKETGPILSNKSSVLANRTATSQQSLQHHNNVIDQSTAIKPARRAAGPSNITASHRLAAADAARCPVSYADEPAAAMTQSIDSLMSSITDLSVVGSEVGYVADMDEANLSTPTITRSWKDSCVNKPLADPSVGDCFIPQGFRPVNFVGLEAKYMIGHAGNRNVMLPTAIRPKQECGTQTSREDSKSELTQTDRATVVQSTATQTEAVQCLKCSCHHKSPAPAQTSQSESTVQKHLLRVSDNHKAKKRRRLSYCSSVDISPLLNGSVVYHRLPERARSADNLPEVGQRSRVYNPVQRRGKLNVINKLNINEVKPEIVISCDRSNDDVTVTNLKKKVPDLRDKTEVSLKTGELDVSKDRTYTNKCISLPDINNYHGEADDTDEPMKKYNSTLIISNVSKHLQSTRHSLKRTSHTQHINNKSSSRKLGLPRSYVYPKDKPEVFKATAKFLDKQRLTPLTSRGQILTYTF